MSEKTDLGIFRIPDGKKKMVNTHKKLHELFSSEIRDHHIAKNGKLKDGKYTQICVTDSGHLAHPVGFLKHLTKLGLHVYEEQSINKQRTAVHVCNGQSKAEIINVACLENYTIPDYYKTTVVFIGQATEHEKKQIEAYKKRYKDKKRVLFTDLTK